MTSRFSAASARYESAADAESTPARTADEGPYARPASVPPNRAVDAVLIDAIRASVGPFVPAQWRSGSATSASDTASPAAAPSASASPEADSLESVAEESGALPWIESFMDTGTNSAAVEVDAPESISPAIELRGAGQSDGVVPIATVPSAARGESVVDAQATTGTTEEWPLEEAGAAMRALAGDLARPHDVLEAASGADVTENESPEARSAPLPMWNDDDMMDIMPVKSAEVSTERGEQWAARARREAEVAGNPESAARALETLARRVRSGEIQLPAFSAEMGEAAALAAALAALLSARR